MRIGGELRAAPGLRAAACVLVTAGAMSGCSLGNQAGQLQVPAVVSGLVTATPACSPGQVCSNLVSVVPGAVVQAIGKDGTHDTFADSSGHYTIALLDGYWTLQALRTPSSTVPGPLRRLRVTAGSPVTVNLSAGP